MSLRFGALRQLGLVVRDPWETMRYWTDTMGVGPFYVVENSQFQDYRYMGKPSESPILTLGYANAEGFQIEIIAQTNDAPSGYLDFLNSGREGLQHLSSWCASREEYDSLYQRSVSSGATVIHEGSAGGPRFAYFDTYGSSGHGYAFEIAEGRLPELAPVHELLTNAARDWDGSDPIRPMPG